MNLKIDEQDELTIDHSQNIKTISWLNWIERWSTKPKVEGSSPSGITKNEWSIVNFISSEFKIDKQSELTIDHSQHKNNLITQMVGAST